MSTYEALRQFADSWMLLYLFLVFIGVILWVIRPGSGPVHEDCANIPLRNETSPDEAEERR